MFESEKRILGGVTNLSFPYCENNSCFSLLQTLSGSNPAKKIKPLELH